MRFRPDYVVVGAGASGCALASRLSEDPAARVVLLEAGRPDAKFEIGVPAAYPKLFKTPLDWNFTTAEEPELGGRRLYWPRGRMLGGNLRIATRAHATRILVEQGRAAGVVCRDAEGSQRLVRAEREVVLYAGAIGSPHLLLLSGIGPKDELEDAGVEVVCPLPGVGRNLQDHPLTGIIYLTPRPVSLAAAESPANLARYLVRRRGLLTSNIGEAHAFVRLDPARPGAQRRAAVRAGGLRRAWTRRVPRARAVGRRGAAAAAQPGRRRPGQRGPGRAAGDPRGLPVRCRGSALAGGGHAPGRADLRYRGAAPVAGTAVLARGRRGVR